MRVDCGSNRVCAVIAPLVHSDPHWKEGVCIAHEFHTCILLFMVCGLVPGASVDAFLGSRASPLMQGVISLRVSQEA